ncbi:MFS transporter [Nitrogeniibacter mangrovi]|uniref:MFS transporter n=1 Tax=Nitrogeniibacter mangrovi TaxID=2016596 RepID=A0A6C1BAL3_9RHOO|nr:MFS transporter [Nitrogeniibacter mangrovi]QID19314.1 MFS transporter [Nitrogeniibacter mangrovi]
MHSDPARQTLGLPGILILLAGQLLPLVDFSIINVALESLSRTLGASHTELELVVAVYGVAFAVCLALGGRLGDRLGRRRVYLWGVGLFGLASLLCGLAGSVPMLLAARALQGVGAALAVPQILASLHVCLRGPAHSKAIGAYGAVGGIAFIIGQVLGGQLVSWDVAGLGWRSIFLINLPVCLSILLSTRRFVPETRSAHAPGFDLRGTGLLALLILCLLVAMSLGPLLHWPAWSLGMLVAVVPLAGGLWRTEQRQRWPLLPPPVMALASMRFGLLLALVFFASWSGFMFVVALTLQAGAGLSSAQSGQAFVMLGAAYFLMALMSARVTRWLGTVAMLLLGFALQVPGLFGLIHSIGAQWSQLDPWTIAPASVFIGAGQALIVSAFYRISLGEVPAADAGAASAMLSTVQQAALGLGPALFGGLFAWSLAQGQDYPRALGRALELEIAGMLGLAVLAALFGLRRRAARLAVERRTG